MEDYRDSRSSTAHESEVDIPLEEKESLLSRVMVQKRKSSRIAVRAILIALLVAILAVSNVILGAVVLGQQRNKSGGKTHASHGHPHNHPQQRKTTPVPLGGLPHVDANPDWLPPEDWRTEVFRLHQIYGEEPVGTAKEAWLSMIPSK